MINHVYKSNAASRGQPAFSLIELLVVVGIMAILMAMIVPASIGLVNSGKLNRASTQLVDEMNSARQTALTKSREVEIRIYQMGSKSAPTDLQYRAFRSFLVDGSDPAKSKPLTPLRYLSEPVILSSDPKYSTLLDHTNGSRSGLVNLTEQLPSGATKYVGFSFRGNGETNLKPVSLPVGNWFLTVFSPQGAKSAQALPDNYCTIQIDPVTGRTRIYRP